MCLGSVLTSISLVASSSCLACSGCLSFSSFCLADLQLLGVLLLAWTVVGGVGRSPILCPWPCAWTGCSTYCRCVCSEDRPFSSWYLLSLPSPWSGVVGGLQDIVKFLSSAASPTRCPSGWRSCCCIDHLLLWLGGDLLLVAGRLAVILCSVMLVGLADILASPRGYHLYLRIVVHLGHVLGIHLLLVVEDEMETVSSSAFFSWLSAEEGASHSIFFTFSCY